MMKLWRGEATYLKGDAKEYYCCFVYAECGDDVFRYLDERAVDLGSVCLCKSCQRADYDCEV